MLMPLVITTITEEGSEVRAIKTGDIVVATTEASPEVAKTNKCWLKTTKPISLPTEETTLKEEEDKTEEVEEETTPKGGEDRTQVFFPEGFVNSVVKMATGKMSVTLDSIVKNAKNQKLQPLSEDNKDDLQSQHDQDDYNGADGELSSIFKTQPAKN